MKQSLFNFRKHNAKKASNFSTVVVVVVAVWFVVQFFLSFAFSSFGFILFFARRIKITTDFSSKESKKLDLRGKTEKGKIVCTLI